MIDPTVAEKSVGIELIEEGQAIYRLRKLQMEQGVPYQPSYGKKMIMMDYL